jgi:hypothetical protein
MQIKPRRMISFKHGESNNSDGLDPDEEDNNELDSHAMGKENEKNTSAVEEPTSEDVEGSTAFEEHLFEKRKRKHQPADPCICPRRCHISDQPPGPEENVLICDNAVEQCVVGQGFKVLFHTGQHVQMDGALVGMEGGRYPIVCAAAVVEDETRESPVIIILNQAAYNQDLQQHESLLHTEQARLHGVKVNDLASFLTDGHGYNGKQNLETEGVMIPLVL